MRCGEQAVLAENPGARVSRCPCGTIHVLMKAPGVTVQFSEERFQQLGLAVMGAVSALGNSTKGSNPPPAPPDRTIN